MDKYSRREISPWDYRIDEDMLHFIPDFPLGKCRLTGSW